MNYSGLNAKIKAMRGALLSDGEYEALCGTGSVEAFGLSLKNRPAYREALQNVPESEIHREQIEQLIRLSLHEDFARIYKFISDFRIRKFLNCYFLKSEIHIIKLLLCMVYDERDVNYTLPQLSELLGGKLNIDLTRLKNAKSVSDFIGGLAGTPFHSVLAPAYHEDMTLFQLETQLDLYYFMQLRKSKNMYLDKANRALVNHLIGAEVDMQNIVWIYRLKKFYDLPQGRIYSYLIPIHYRLSVEQMNRMVQSRTNEDLMTEVGRTAYADVFVGAADMEAAEVRAAGRLYRAAGIGHANTLAVTLGYIFSKEQEIKNLISILEGIRYGLAPKAIIGYILPRKEERGAGAHD